MNFRLVKGTGLAVAALLLPTSVTLAGGVQIDSNFASYAPVGGVTGTIKSVGSDTMVNMMTLWAEGFHDVYPDVRAEIEGKGSATAPPALISGQCTFGPMSRLMKDDEAQAFEDAYGYKPTPLATSIDMLAVYVNKDCPIDGLTLQQVDAIFSKNRNGGYPTDIRTWGDLGLTGEWASKPISLYGRNSASGTYAYFRKHALFKGDYKDSVKEQPGSSSVVQGVASDKYGIGYSGIGYKTADVKAIGLAEEPGADIVPATAEYAYTGDYPLSRTLWLNVNYKPGSQLDPLRREFIRYVFSRQGQEAVVKDGYYPISAEMARQQLALVGLGAP